MKTAPSVVTSAEAENAYESAQMVVETHRRLVDFLRVGQTLAQVDAFIAKQLADQKSRSCFLGYSMRGLAAKFPSHACLSLNDCVVHGTAGYHLEPLKEGDVLKIDIGLTYQGWIGDAGWTYCIKTQSESAKKLMDCGKEALRRGIEVLRPGRMFMHWARTVQSYVEKENGFHLVRGLGGHGYGRKLHTPPFISNVETARVEEWTDALVECKTGMLVAVEPMLCIGTPNTRQEKNKWPVYSADGSLTVHYEHDVLITENDPRVLTEGMDSLPDVVE